MTNNEQKAKEIAKHILETYPVINKDNLPNALWFAAIEMAEWKDEQLTKLIIELDELKHQVNSLSFQDNGEIVMTKEEFIKNVVTISKYNGDISSYINDNLENVEIPFSLNDSFTGILTKEGEDGYMADKVGQKVRLQFHNLMRFKSPVGAETLPVIDCKLTR